MGRRMRRSRAGKLGDWEVGRLVDQEIGGLGDWGIGKLVDWRIGGIGRCSSGEGPRRRYEEASIACRRRQPWLSKGPYPYHRTCHSETTHSARHAPLRREQTSTPVTPRTPMVPSLPNSRSEPQAAHHSEANRARRACGAAPFPLSPGGERASPAVPGREGASSSTLSSSPPTQLSRSQRAFSVYAMPTGLLKGGEQPFYRQCAPRPTLKRGKRAAPAGLCRFPSPQGGRGLG